MEKTEKSSNDLESWPSISNSAATGRRIAHCTICIRGKGVSIRSLPGPHRTETISAHRAPVQAIIKGGQQLTYARRGLRSTELAEQRGEEQERRQEDSRTWKKPPPLTTTRPIWERESEG